MPATMAKRLRNDPPVTMIGAELPVADVLAVVVEEEPCVAVPVDWLLPVLVPEAPVADPDPVPVDPEAAVVASAAPPVVEV